MNSSRLKFHQYFLRSLTFSSMLLTSLVNLFIKASTSSFTNPSFLTIESSSLSIAYVIDLSKSEVSKSVQQKIPNILFTCSIFSSLLILISSMMWWYKARSYDRAFFTHSQETMLPSRSSIETRRFVIMSVNSSASRMTSPAPSL